MANNLDISASLNLTDGTGTDETLSIEDVAIALGSRKYQKCKIDASTVEQALPLGEVASLGYIIALNRDPTNIIQIRTGTGATKMVRVRPGAVAVFEFGDGVTAPYVIADAGTPELEYLLCSSP